MIEEEASSDKQEKLADSLTENLKRDPLETMNYLVFCKFGKLGCTFHHKNTQVENKEWDERKCFTRFLNL